MPWPSQSGEDFYLPEKRQKYTLLDEVKRTNTTSSI